MSERDNDQLLEMLRAAYITVSEGLATCAACQGDRHRWTHVNDGICAAICARAHILDRHHATAVLTIDALRPVLEPAIEPEYPTVEAHNQALNALYRHEGRANRLYEGLDNLRRNMATFGLDYGPMLSHAANLRLSGMIGRAAQLLTRDALDHVIPVGVAASLRLVKESSDAG